MTKYTFLLPAYKATFFEEALCSIKNQTYMDFKCIVSDDCSPDDLKSIFDRVCGGDHRFSFRRNEENMGIKNLVGHWNLLVSLCETEYFMMAGDDDLYLPGFLTSVNQLQEKYPEAGVIRSRSQYIDQNGEITDQDSVFPEYQDALTFLFYRYNCFFISGILNYAFRKDVIIKEKQFLDLPVAWAADEAAVISCSKYGICTTNDILTSMRISGINISCQRNPEISKLKIAAIKSFHEWLLDFIRDTCKADTILQKNKLESVLVNANKASLMSIVSYVNDLNLFERLKLLKELSSKEFIGKGFQTYKNMTLLIKGN